MTGPEESQSTATGPRANGNGASLSTGKRGVGSDCTLGAQLTRAKRKRRVGSCSGAGAAGLRHRTAGAATQTWVTSAT